MKLTTYELAALEAIVKSEYQDGDNPVGHDVWTKYVNPFKTKRVQSGIYASLSKKALIQIGSMRDVGPGHGKMGTVAITQAGFDAYKAAKPAPAPQAKVHVQFWHAGEVPHGTEASVGVSHAKMGYPVAVRIARGNNSHSLHLSLAEVRELAAQFAPLTELKE